MVAQTETKRILIVDDERLNINILVSILSDDYEIVIAKSGEQTLKRVEAQAPDLVRQALMWMLMLQLCSVI